MATYTYRGAYLINLNTGTVSDVGITSTLVDDATDNSFTTSDVGQTITVSGATSNPAVNTGYTNSQILQTGNITLVSGGVTLTGVYAQLSNNYLVFIPTIAGTFTAGSTFSVTGGTGAGFNYADVAAQGNDTLTLDPTGPRNMQGGAGDDSITGSNFAETISGGIGNDTIIGNSGNDSITGNAGADSLTGGAGNDTILGGTENDTIRGGANIDQLSGGGGNDSIFGDAGNDTIAGGAGADTIEGGDGNDLILGDGGDLGITRGVFRWSNIPDPDDGGVIDDNDILATADNTNVATQVSSGIQVTLGYDQEANGTNLSFQDVANFVTGIETGTLGAVNPASSGQLLGNKAGAAGIGDENTSTLTFSFSSVDPSLQDEVTNVQFNVNDIDIGTGGSSFIDRIVIRAFDSAGNRIPVAVTVPSGAGTRVTLSDAPGDGLTAIDSGTGNTALLSNADAEGSVTVRVQGPVARVEIDYENDGTGAQAVTVTDVYFTPLRIDEPGGAADSISGGIGNDTIIGGVGNDTISGGTGNDLLDGRDGNDSITGGDNNDTLIGGIGNDTLDGGAGADTMTGGAGFDVFVADGASPDLITDFDSFTNPDINDDDQTNNDFVNLQSFYNPTTVAAYNLANGTDFKNGLELMRADQDGTIGTAGVLDLAGGLIIRNGEAGNATSAPENLTFDNTNVICFTPGTMIVTATGLRRVEDLAIGDFVVTRDHGLRRLAWVGKRELTAAQVTEKPKLAPVLIRKGAFGPNVPNRDMMVSPQHRVLLSGHRLALTTGETEALAPAISLVNGDSVTQLPPQDVCYLHLMCDGHEVIKADGLWTETLFPGDEALNGLTPECREEVTELFPDLKGFAAARTMLSGRQVQWVNAS